ncbi:glycosyltransferase [soil metagenome]
MTVSVITIARGRLEHLCNQRRGLALQQTPPDEHIIVRMGGCDLRPALDPAPYPSILIDVAVDGDALPLAGARNAGAQVASGETMVFLDVDCVPDPCLIGAFAGSAGDGGLRSGPVWYLPPTARSETTDFDELRKVGARHPAQPVVPPGGRMPLAPNLFWSLNFAVEPACLLNVLGGFDERYVGYGAEDTDLAWTAAARGVPLTHIADAQAFHQHHPSPSPPLQHIDAIVRNATLFHAKWGVWPMLGWLERFAELELIRLHDDRIERIA